MQFRSSNNQAAGPEPVERACPEPVERACAELVERAPALSLSKGPALSLSKGPALSLSKGFSLIEVMMASIILVVGFVGMIEAVTIGSGMMDNARRQTLATQILNHEIEKLRLVGWSATTTVGGTTFTGGITGLPTASTAIAIDSQFTTAIAASGAAYTLTRTIADVVSGSLREATFTITWVVNTSRRDGAGVLLTFTYSRTNTAYYGKYGLNLSYQRS